MQKKTTNKVEMPSPMIKNRSNKVSVLVLVSIYLGAGAKYQSTENQKSELTKCIYHVKPGGITTVGLVNIDFDKIKFITIVLVESGINIIQSGKVGSYKDLCIKIRGDHSPKGISEQEA